MYPERQRAAWHADNPAHQIRASFTPDGVQVETTTGDTLSRRIGMTLRSAGYGERQMGVGAARVTTTSNRIEYARALVGDDTAAGSIAEWYVNTPAGLEQGFTLDAAPGARRPGERLRVVLGVDGALRAQRQPDGQALAFVDEAGRPVLRYDHLVVTDARGRELAARMDAEAGQVWLELDDRDAVFPITIDPLFTLQQKLEPSDAAEGDEFGVSVAISGETVVVGASRDDGAAGGNQGSAYVFVRSGGIWIEQQKLVAPDGEASVFFGTSVAISGETVVVGAFGDEFGLAGSAYVFVRSGGVWSLQRKLEDPDGEDGFFGNSVAISGETVVVGAVGDDGAAGDRQGSAYVFVRSGGDWSLQQKLVAPDAVAGDRLGASVAISGETIVVGADNDDGEAGFTQGSAYVFVRSGGAWGLQKKLEASDAGDGDFFGASVAISGETVVVGAFGDDRTEPNQGAAYLFVRNGGVWTQQQKLVAPDAVVFNEFGVSVTISGETAVVGELDDGAAGGNQGSAYVFVRRGGVWSLEQKLEASDAAANDRFGASVAISGETVVVGAEGDDGVAGGSQGSAFVFVVDAPPTITLKAPIVFWPPTHQYRTLTVAQMVQSASDPEDGDLLSSVMIEKVTSDEPDNGDNDGNTRNDIVIGGTCKSADLRAERDETQNGRVYSITLRVMDAVGNVTRAVFQVSVPRGPGFPAAIEDSPLSTVTSSCS